jgi:hypothetical protein
MVANRISSAVVLRLALQAALQPLQYSGISL